MAAVARDSAQSSHLKTVLGVSLCQSFKRFVEPNEVRRSESSGRYWSGTNQTKGAELRADSM